MRAVMRLLLAATMVGCGGGDGLDGESASEDASLREPDAAAAQGDAGGPAAKFSEIYSEFFPLTTNARCNFCHAMPPSDTSNGKLSIGMTQEQAYQALVGKQSTSSRCGGMPLVTPGEPEASLLYLKFREPTPCGARMPLGGAKLSEAQLARLRGWITAGAKND